jgi:ActD protein
MSRPVIVSVFEREDHILQATTAARQEGFEIVDVFTPYAVHGMDRAMGLSRSRLPWVCFVLGLSGAAFSAWFQYWASAVSWPIDVGGKPWHSWPAFIPIVFEVMVLCGGVGTVLFFIGWTGLRPGRQSPVSDLRVTDDRFALAIRPAADRFDRLAVDAMLNRFHAVHIEERDIPAPANRAGR